MPDKTLDMFGDSTLPDEATYRRAARTLAANAHNPTELAVWLEMIGHPAMVPTVESRPPVVPRPRANASRQSPVCRRGIHAMSGSNLIVDSGGRRCRECRRDTARRRLRGEA